MITITPSARKKIAEIIQAKNQHEAALRLRITGRGTDEFNYEMRFVDLSTRQPGDEEIDLGEFVVLVDAESMPNLRGTVIDFGGLGEGGLRIDNPNPVWNDSTARAVAEVIERQINPGIKAHGGHIDLVDVNQGVAYITMSGGCQGCGMANITLKLGIDRMIREAVPAIHEIVDTTEHGAGQNPFFKSPVGGQSPLARN